MWDANPPQSDTRGYPQSAARTTTETQNNMRGPLVAPPSRSQQVLQPNGNSSSEVKGGNAWSQWKTPAQTAAMTKTTTKTTTTTASWSETAARFTAAANQRLSSAKQQQQQQQQEMRRSVPEMRRPVPEVQLPPEGAVTKQEQNQQQLSSHVAEKLPLNPPFNYADAVKNKRRQERPFSGPPGAPRPPAPREPPAGREPPAAFSIATDPPKQLSPKAITPPAVPQGVIGSPRAVSPPAPSRGAPPGSTRPQPQPQTVEVPLDSSSLRPDDPPKSVPATRNVANFDASAAAASLGLQIGSMNLGTTQVDWSPRSSMPNASLASTSQTSGYVGFGDTRQRRPGGSSQGPYTTGFGRDTLRQNAPVALPNHNTGYTQSLPPQGNPLVQAASHGLFQGNNVGVTSLNGMGHEPFRGTIASSGLPSYSDIPYGGMANGFAQNPSGRYGQEVQRASHLPSSIPGSSGSFAPVNGMVNGQYSQYSEPNVSYYGRMQPGGSTQGFSGNGYGQPQPSGMPLNGHMHAPQNPLNGYTGAGMGTERYGATNGLQDSLAPSEYAARSGAAYNNDYYRTGQ
eukprot:Plantae.Rhodophyta-Hildenbrandia_rubra.ctg6000.p1 GENE.Plantae.Rhodophyta-Hildenbrandia_rubra.ctg6000~~Plantae.Rhodophyta-Hildenbrandia_rubra.ctg6000.p1  ORF type:complete len:568 (+),score=84.81 Plantae.Rhodophyta-Hildenbrandia_rubra.ctg6000:2304-4007(+)